MDPRQQFLADLLTQFFAVRQAWVESDAKFITEALEQAADELVAGFSDGAIPGDFRKLERVISLEFEPAWQRFKDDAASTGDPHLLPGDAFWLAVAHVEKAREEAEPRQPQSIESIETLRRQGVSDRQICLIYDWVDGRGNPELWRLREEEAEPGKHTKHWVSAAERRRQEQNSRQQQLRRQIAERQTRKVEQLTKPCQESIEELLAQGLSATQIAEMRRCNVDEVFEEADRLGVARPPLNYSPLGTGRGVHDADISEAQARIHDATAKNGRGRRAAPPKPNKRSSPPAVDEEGDDPAADADRADIDDDDVLDAEEAFAMSEADDAAEPAAGNAAPAGESQTLEQEIVAYSQAGMDEHAIAQAVSAPGQKIGVKKVRAILNRFAEEPAAFG